LPVFATYGITFVYQADVFFFLLKNRIATRFAGIFGLSDEKPEVLIFCLKPLKNRKILRIITNAKKRGGADSNPSNPHKY